MMNMSLCCRICKLRTCFKESFVLVQMQGQVMAMRSITQELSIRCTCSLVLQELNSED